MMHPGLYALQYHLVCSLYVFIHMRVCRQRDFIMDIQIRATPFELPQLELFFGFRQHQCGYVLHVFFELVESFLCLLIPHNISVGMFFMYSSKKLNNSLVVIESTIWFL
jgi:hypothetical protein